MSVMLINPFLIPKDKDEEFLRAWNYTTYLYSNMPGFIQTHLHKNVVSVDKFRYVNFAVWATPDDCNEAHAKHKPGEEYIQQTEHHPGIFSEEIASINTRGRVEPVGSVHLINLFVVPEGKEEEFVIDWNYNNYLSSQKPGFIESHFYKNTNTADQSFQFVNFGIWESADAIEAAHTGPEAAEFEISGIESYAGFYHNAFSIKSLQGAK